jgi:hypothetical protein
LGDNTVGGKVVLRPMMQFGLKWTHFYTSCVLYV